MRGDRRGRKRREKQDRGEEELRESNREEKREKRRKGEKRNTIVRGVGWRAFVDGLNIYISSPSVRSGVVPHDPSWGIRSVERDNKQQTVEPYTPTKKDIGHNLKFIIRHYGWPMY